MYIYNITVNIDESVKQEWLNWVTNTHIPNMLNSGKFSKAKLSQVLVNEEMGGVTYSIQFTATSLENLHLYYKEDADKFNDESARLFKDKFVMFGTELKVVSEQFQNNNN
ncbi:MAG TPA: DUF4286 family protein [Flavobacteriaceae bacterium]|nr:DUF4286 family protein [Flavobacteriaceae bacterium]